MDNKEDTGVNIDVSNMKLITDGNDNYSLMDGDEVVATTMYSLTAEYFLDLKQIKTLLPIKEDDEFEKESLVVKQDMKIYMLLKRSLITVRNTKLEQILSEDEFCHYSGLPSPAAYQLECADYDSMGNHGRFPKQKTTSKSSLEKITDKIKNKLR